MKKIIIATLGLFLASTSAYAIDSACSLTDNNIYTCPENSTDWYEMMVGANGIVDNLDALLKTSPSSFTVKGVLGATGDLAIDGTATIQSSLTVVGATLLTGAVTLPDSTVTTSKLSNGSVTTPKLNAEALDGFAGLLNLTNTGIHSILGKLGIGTASPADNLEVFTTEGGGTNTLDHAVSITRGNTMGSVGRGVGYVLRGSDNASTLVDGAMIAMEGEGATWTATGTTRDAAMTFHTTEDDSLTEKMRITSAGNVGIGTASPAAKNGGSPAVEVSGTSPEITLSASSNGAGSSLNFSAKTGGGVAQDYFIGPNITQTNAYLEFYDKTQAKSRITLDTSGNVGIGTASPLSTLSVNGDSSFSDASTFNSSVTVRVGAVYGDGIRIISSNNNPHMLNLREATDAYGFSIGLESVGGDTVFHTVENELVVSTPIYIDRGTGNVGVGMDGSSPPGQTLSVQGKTEISTDGSFDSAPATGDDLVVSGASGTGISIIGPDSTANYLYIGNATDSSGASFSFNDATNKAAIGTETSNGQLLLVSGNGSTAVTIDASQKTTFSSDSVVVTTSQSPAATDACTTGEIAWDASYIYICTASTVWKRAALTGGY